MIEDRCRAAKPSRNKTSWPGVRGERARTVSGALLSRLTCIEVIRLALVGLTGTVAGIPGASNDAGYSLGKAEAAA